MRRVLLLVAAFALVGCGEREQVVVYKQGKYQGKPDNRSWDNDPLPAEFRGGTWTKVITGTTLNQNVYVLMGKGTGAFQLPGVSAEQETGARSMLVSIR